MRVDQEHSIKRKLYLKKHANPNFGKDGGDSTNVRSNNSQSRPSTSQNKPEVSSNNNSTKDSSQNAQQPRQTPKPPAPPVEYDFFSGSEPAQKPAPSGPSTNEPNDSSELTLESDSEGAFC